MKHYVYVHRRKDNNEIFYVGKGTGSRYRTHKTRSKEWEEIVSKYGVLYEIIKYFETNIEAMEYETYLINNTDNLINKNKKSGRNNLCFEEVNDKFYYDESSPSCLRYKQDTLNYKKDEVAGHLDHYGYWDVYNKRTCKVHRIIWLLFNKNLPIDLYINHIDNNPSNNKISNLELVTPSENSSRTVKQLKEDNGICIVENWCKTKYKRFYVASVMRQGIKKYKRFSIEKYGEVEAKRLAYEYRDYLMNIMEN